tara:strand:+ start:764 stop:1045 length:282 start_codon:yes stop_codon:yes gene_type:complete
MVQGGFDSPLSTIAILLEFKLNIMENIMQDLRDLRDNTPCLEEHSKCGCEKFDYIIDKIDDKQTHLKNQIEEFELGGISAFELINRLTKLINN